MRKRRYVRVMFSNGEVIEAPTWTALLERWRQIQHRYYSRSEFRKEVKHRAFVWSGINIPTGKEVSAKTMFHSLNSAAVVKILPSK